MFQKTVNITFFTGRCALNFFFTEESLCFHCMDSFFNSGSLWQTHVYLLCKYVFLLKHASSGISYILLQISHGLHISATKTLMTELGLSLKIKTIFTKKKTIPNNAEFKFMKKKKNLEKIFCFSSKNPLIN